MEGISATFTQKFGPLPVWGWAALGLAALLGWWYVKKQGVFAPQDTSGAAAGAGQAVGATSDQLAGLNSALGALGQMYGQQGGPPAADQGTGGLNAWNPVPAPVPVPAPGGGSGGVTAPPTPVMPGPWSHGQVPTPPPGWEVIAEGLSPSGAVTETTGPIALPGQPFNPNGPSYFTTNPPDWMWRLQPIPQPGGLVAHPGAAVSNQTAGVNFAARPGAAGTVTGPPASIATPTTTAPVTRMPA